jgi:N,N-dimethylformamidase
MNDDDARRRGAIPLIGYADRLSARPGETIEFKISSTSPQPFEARIVRIICADPNPDGPGIVTRPAPSAIDGSYPSRFQDYRLGSCVAARGGLVLDSFTLVATIWPTTPAKGEQGILCALDADDRGGAALLVAADGSVGIRFAAGGKIAAVSVGVPLQARRWYRAWASYDAATGAVAVGQMPLDGEAAATRHSMFERQARFELAPEILLAAMNGPPPHSLFNGKMEMPAIYPHVLAEQDLYARDAGTAARDAVACWDFSRGISTLDVEDLGPHRLNGRLVNLPARGMTGSSWRAQEMCWRHAPQHYGAIHFHDDDFYDCDWQTDLSFTVPRDMRSGVYALWLRCGAHEDNIPFFICPPKGTRQSELCVVMPTFTYVIYSNNARYDYGPALEARMAAWKAYPWNPAKHPEYGLSAYNVHSDGSGICNVSSRRPLLTLRCGYLTLLGPRCGSGLRHFQADTHVLAWLDHHGIDCDIVTDQELNDDGAAALAPYKAVFTTTHPEYHTAASLDAYQGYRDAGGRLAYLGGNGFYWRVALHAQAPGAIEIRRGEGGIRTWASEPGEYYNAFDGAYGGLWRRSGRAPQKLVGVGFSAQGTFNASYYRRTPEAADPRVAWILDGIDAEVLGDFGLSGEGAAGYELDRVDRSLGSPDQIIVIARSEKHAATYIAVPEEVLTHVSTLSGDPPEALIRAEMAYFETPRGGAVFSVGSITFCGSLPFNRFDNDISRLLLNVARRFLR